MVRGQSATAEMSAVEAVRSMEATTRYRFLYRDALLAGVRVRVDPSSSHPLEALDDALRSHGLRLDVDSARAMAFVVPDRRQRTTPLQIRGTVSDAASLERLPHATIAWRGPADVEGVVTDEAGRFILTLPEDAKDMSLVVSFLGYEPDSISVDAQAPPSDLSVKLRPRVVVGSEVVISSPLLASNLDSTWHYLLNASLATPAGDASVTRSLQMLPAVGVTTAVSSGLSVRGSRTDGFQILLDGVPIYSQSHLFGMFDAFSPDALQAVDFYYGIAPARFQAPPGGTLSFITRPGSKQRMKTTLGANTTAVAGTAEGPVGTARGSWIVSARRSYLDQVSWFNNDALVSIGTGVGRETSSTRRVPLDERTLKADPPTADFYDVHAKFDHEADGGASFQITAYAGGDETAQKGVRVIAVNPGNQDPRVTASVTTTNDWGNAAFSAHHRTAVRPWGYAHTYLGLTRYYAHFRKDDFLYVSRAPGNSPPQYDFAPFLNDNDLVELRLAHESFLLPSPGVTLSTGFSLQRLSASYQELSALRREFESDRRAWQLDLFAETTMRRSGWSITAGLRPHYFSAGRFLRVSPRITLARTVFGRGSFSLGYTRNYQFAHRLYVENDAGSSIWTLTSESEPPGSVNHFTGSLLLRPAGFTAQVEAYLKMQDNLRRHETLGLVARLGDAGILLTPWSHDNDLLARGLEFLLSRRVGPAALTATYTLSKTEIRNATINDGGYFYAEWDRPHQLVLHAQVSLSASLSASTAFTMASGQPNPFILVDSSQPARTPTYRRTDLALNYKQAAGPLSLAAYFRVYNVLDRTNTWYKTAETVLAGRGQNLRLAFEPIDVYDLGIQPSLGITITI